MKKILITFLVFVSQVFPYQVFADVGEYENQITTGTIDISKVGALIVDENGDVWELYENYDGKNTYLAKVEGLKNVKQVATVSYVNSTNLFHALNYALLQDGTLWTWEAKKYFEDNELKLLIEQPVIEDKLNHEKIVSISGINFILDQHIILLTEEGKGYTRPAGYINLDPITEVVAVEGRIPETFKAPISAISVNDIYSHYSAISLKKDGTVWVYSRDYSWKLNNDTSFPEKQMGTFKNAVDIGQGVGSFYILQDDGSIMTWGSNNNGLLGFGIAEDELTYQLEPKKINSLSDIVAIDVGTDTVAALKKDGTVWMWGANTYGQLGHSLEKDIEETYDMMQYGSGTSYYNPNPISVEGLTDVIEVAVTSNRTIAKKKDGSIWLWGEEPEQSAPKQVKGIKGFVPSIFKDVPNGYWARSEIEALFHLKVIGGYGNGLFGPKDTVTRSQAFVMLARALDLNLENRPKPGFKDISSNHWAYHEIAAIMDEGIFPKAETLNPNKAIKRDEMALLLVNAYNLSGQYEKEFSDVPKDYWAYDVIQKLAANKITLGIGGGKFAPNAVVTRAQFSVFMHRVLNK